MNVEPEYAHSAVKKYGEKILREQINLDKTCEVAASEIKFETQKAKTELNESEETTSINDDWLNNFEKEASLKSTEEMQILFGRILAGEIQQPNSFSIKTVKLLANLNEQVANLFQLFCSLCVSLRPNNSIFEVRVLSLGGNAGANALQDYGLNFDRLNLLHEYGLIISDYNSYLDFRMCVANENRQVSIGFIYENEEWGLLPINERKSEQELRLHGVALSRSGKELLKIVDITRNQEYSFALKDYFKGLDLEMLKITKQ